MERETEASPSPLGRRRARVRYSAGTPLQRKMLLDEGSINESVRDMLAPIALSYSFKDGAHFYPLPSSFPAYLTRSNFETLKANSGKARMDVFCLHTGSHLERSPRSLDVVAHRRRHHGQPGTDSQSLRIVFEYWSESITVTPPCRHSRHPSVSYSTSTTPASSASPPTPHGIKDRTAKIVSASLPPGLAKVEPAPVAVPFCKSKMFAFASPLVRTNIERYGHFDAVLGQFSTFGVLNDKAMDVSSNGLFVRFLVSNGVVSTNGFGNSGGHLTLRFFASIQWHSPGWQTSYGTAISTVLHI
ncbi:hypothetical protein PAXRUDRAFT_12952 [Paxillus rubicundulus Ve08.2h10]|uniref:Uncharacterized protein n=1 Tax=Paxillus rubicundulus Ve08.2h10 TaxID=930991 RepID=A0A0D0DMM9_9AGAM|nr:hypothetical protein PAXRUDRAFT_12952 [Paxillus rubicundulus Ve08.2h10]